MQVQGEHAGEDTSMAALGHVGSQSTEELKKIHQLVDFIKKTEQKQRKLKETVKTRGEQWQLFQIELKRSFVQQRQCYSTDIQKAQG